MTELQRVREILNNHLHGESRPDDIDEAFHIVNTLLETPQMAVSPCERLGHEWVFHHKSGSFERGYFDNFYCSRCMANTQMRA